MVKIRRTQNSIADKKKKMKIKLINLLPKRTMLLHLRELMLRVLVLFMIFDHAKEKFREFCFL